MAETGSITLFLALLAALYSAFAHALGAKRPFLFQSARVSLFGVFGLLSISTLTLLIALLTHDFRIEYVAYYSSTDTSLPYLISGLWAGNKGSLLFWAWLLSLFAVITAVREPRRNRDLVPYSSSIIMFTAAFFLIILVSIANPFDRLDFLPVDGMGLNPMLENIGMVIHPPALLAGYVALTVPFALAMAALLAGKPDGEWLASFRKWALVSWLLLGAGNVIGAWWAYVELGWGGYWAWDPVENAGLLPWLVTTALLHSVVMQRRKRMFKGWNMLLIILAFNLAIFGTFLTRSGVLSSVHTFGESRLGPFFLAFLAITFFGSLGLLYYRRQSLKSKGEIESMVSRENTFLINNLLLLGSAAVIFLGTMFPAISEGIRGVKIEVGASFFNQVNGPLSLIIVALAGICTLIGWLRPAGREFMKRLMVPLAVAIVLALILIATGMREPYPVIALSLCAFVFSGIVYRWSRETGGKTGVSRISRFWQLLRTNQPRYGGYVVHLGIVLIAIGVIGSSFYGVEKEVTVKPGESISINNYILTYDKIGHKEDGSKFIFTSTLSIYNGHKPLGTLSPEKYFHQNYEQPVSEVAIRSTPLEDLYVVLLDWQMDGSTTFQVMVKPLVSWIWAGGGVLVIGGLIAFLPGRRKRLGKAGETGEG